MIHDRLRELDIKITELASYLELSRPTMYKFIDLYDTGNTKDINSKVKSLFDYINNNKLIGKNNVINFILNNLVDVKDMDDKEENKVIKSVKKYMLEHKDDSKHDFIYLITKDKTFDPVIDYLMDISSIVKKRKLTKEEQNKLEAYRKIVDLILKEKEGI